MRRAILRLSAGNKFLVETRAGFNSRIAWDAAGKQLPGGNPPTTYWRVMLLGERA